MKHRNEYLNKQLG